MFLISGYVFNDVSAMNDEKTLFVVANDRFLANSMILDNN